MNTSSPHMTLRQLISVLLCCLLVTGCMGLTAVADETPAQPEAETGTDAGNTEEAEPDMYTADNEPAVDDTEEPPECGLVSVTFDFGDFGMEIFTDAAFYANTLLNSAAMVGIAYVVLPIGLKLKSSKATLVAAFIVIMLTQGNIGSYTLFNNLLLYAALLICAAVCVFLCIFRVETEDVG